ncbi:MAG: mechanosensitive ion channel family protein [Ignavibacterium sp.]|jgi:small-conductance mechanosensitive channel
MDFLDHHYFGNSVQQWLIAFGVVIVSLLLLKFIRALLIRRLVAMAEKTETQVDDFLVDVFRKTRRFFVVILALYAGAQFITIPASVTGVLDIVVVITVLLQVGFWGNAMITFLVGRVVKARMATDGASATTVTALGFLGRLILWSVVLLVALDNVGVNITGLATGLGIGGIAIALAVQSILGDLFASLSIVLDKPFVIGDFIIVDQYLGTVEHIGLKTTRVRSLSGEQVIFSNADLLKSRIRNYKRMFERRVVFGVGITYQTPREKVELVSRILKESIEKQSVARFDRAHFKEFGDSALTYEAVYYVKSPEYNVYMDTQQTINLEIMRRFEEEKIEFAYPTRTLYVHQG